MSSITISTKAMGRRKPLVPDWQFPWPPAEHGDGERVTLRQVITRLVLEEVTAFKKRQQERQFVRVLTERQIECGVGKGRVDSGGRDLHQTVDPDAAVGAALQAFEDGIYLVILDGEEQRDLEREVHVHAKSHLVFVRLVMLAGA